MKPVLVDTSILIDFLRAPHKKDSQLIGLVERGRVLFVSIITHTELYAGKGVWENMQARTELEFMFSGIQVLPITIAISKRTGEIRAKYGIDLIDALIAATGIEYHYPIATINKKDFMKVEGLVLE